MKYLVAFGLVVRILYLIKVDENMHAPYLVCTL